MAAAGVVAAVVGGSSRTIVVCRMVYPYRMPPSNVPYDTSLHKSNPSPVYDQCMTNAAPIVSDITLPAEA